MANRHQAAVHQFAIHQDRTGTALPLAASFLGSGEANLGAQDVEQALHGIDRHGVGRAIHGEGNVALTHWLPFAASAVSSDSAGRSGSAVIAPKLSCGSK